MGEFVASKRPQFIAAGVATVGAFGLGTVLSWTSVATPDLKVSNTLGKLTDEDISWIGAILTIGALASCPITGFCIEKLGRKSSMLLLSVPFVVAWFVIAFSQSLTMMLIGRFITGFCGGAVSVIAPVYIGETAEPKVRGTLGSAFQLSITLGILFTYILGTFISWKWLSLVCGCVPLVFIVLITFIPESPHYLISKGKHAEANKALCWLRGADSSQQVEEELKIIEGSIDESKVGKVSLRDLFQLHIFTPIAICLGLMLFQQLSGINAVIFYTVTIFKDAGTSVDSNLSTIIVGVVQVVTTIVASSLVDRAGRRILLLASNSLMAISLVLLGIFFQLKLSNNDQAPHGVGWLPLVSLIFFIIAFSIGSGPVAWIMVGEILPPTVKGFGAGIATGFNWFLAFIVTKFFVNLKDAVGIQWCFWLFAIICIGGSIFVYTIVPETKGKSMEAIQLNFKKPLSMRSQNNDSNRP